MIDYGVVRDWGEWSGWRGKLLWICLVPVFALDLVFLAVLRLFRDSPDA